MYQALYRKWRPKAFSDVIGQSHITETLQRQVAEGRTSHAYLFTGTRGTGKTTCAKILAKAVNCEHPVNGDPCNCCPSCLGIESGNFLDVLELDAASNNGVDQVRALRDEAIYSPAHVKKRVYIVDEVHMLSVPAFNALLKILEEPPEHLMFILATTELHKVPATILSRCQRYSFKRIQPHDIAQRLGYVASQEGIDLRPDGAELLSRLADGALRDGLSLLDQCAATGGTIDANAVLDVLGLAGNLQTAQLMEHILNRDAQSALLLLDRLYADGKDVGAVLGELSTLTRDLLLRRTAPRGGEALLSGGYDAAVLDRLDASSRRLLFLASTLQKTTADLYASTNRRTDAELCLLRMCDESLSGDLTALEARVALLEEGGVAARPAPPAKSVRMQKERPAGDEPVAAPARREEQPASATAPVPQSAEPEIPVEDRPPWEEPPLPEEPPMREEPGVRVFDIPEEFAKPEKASAPASTGASTADAVPAGEIPAPVRPASDGTAIPRPAPAGPAAERANLDSSWWRNVVAAAKPQLPPMNRAFLEMCMGVLEGDLVTVYAPDDITVGRLDNDRVKGVLTAEIAKATGTTARISFRTGEPPKVSPEDNFKNLLKFGSQFDNVTIR